MDIRDKVVKSLSDCMVIDYVRLEDDDGISGFVVSPRFQDMSALDRQRFIQRALSKSPTPLTAKERRRVLMIAGITPEEYEVVGTPVRVERVMEMAGGEVEILLYGSLPDAEFVRAALKSQKGVETSELESTPGAMGPLISFRAKGTGSTPLTRAKTIRILKKERYIEVMANT